MVDVVTAGFDRRIERALRALSSGRPVIVTDDEDRENEGDLILAAGLATPSSMGFLVRHTSGFLCVALPGEDCDRLDLPPMRQTSSDAFGTAYCVTVDAVGEGMTTGISAADRARTARALADPASGPASFARPGHVVPLRARPGGVLVRAGHTEAALDLMKLAGLRPAGVLCEIVSARNPTQMARRAELRAFALEHHLEMLSIAELAEYRRQTEPQVEREACASLPLAAGRFRAIGYRGTVDRAEHVALVCGDVAGRTDVPTYVHHECVLGDVAGSSACDCRGGLEDALERIGHLGSGIILYLRGPVDRPTGIMSQLRALELSRSGIPTVAPDQVHGRMGGADHVIAGILTDLGPATVRLLPPAPHGQDVTRALAGRDLTTVATNAVS